MSRDGARARPASRAAWPRLSSDADGAEVECGRGLDADGSLAQRHAVEVLLENRLLGKVALEPERPEDLRTLPLQLRGRAAQDPRELHGDGRAAGDDAARAEVDQRRARNGAKIDTRDARRNGDPRPRGTRR